MDAKLYCVLTAAALMTVGRWSVADGHDLRRQQQLNEQLNSLERSGRQKRSETVRWSKWFNSDRPWIGQGDFETTDVIERHHTICYSDQEVVSAQCRVAGSNVTFGPKTPDSEGDRLLQACTTHGVICLNVQQPSGRCKDYEVRFLCQDIDDTHPGSLFPNFDFKIYLVLIAVPLVVIMLRVLWSCCSKRRLKRRRQEQQRHRGSLGSSLSSSSDGDDVSIDPALANPPPAYSELFGSVRSNVFAISGGFCLGHSKCVHCEHAAAAMHAGQGEQDVSERSQDANSSAAGENIPSTVQSSSIIASENNDLNDDVFAPDAAADRSNSVTSADTVTSADPAMSSDTATSHEQRTLPSVGSSSSLVGAVAASPSATQPAPGRTPCACPCHNFRGPMPGLDNLSFHWDSSDYVSTPVAPMYPGMHKPVFLFPRNSSVTSFTEPPDYEQALEILKKNEAELGSVYM
ncbi:hypothetical protein BaRGS_00038777 [Batillaria attramentaria]|uniref:WxxW domain-containing protein n=1 Tax=Batillaria attramentaria TaxID=370345 RepID=A0ABD0J4X7_9CAEN